MSIRLLLGMCEISNFRDETRRDSQSVEISRNPEISRDPEIIPKKSNCVTSDDRAGHPGDLRLSSEDLAILVLSTNLKISE
ncbi:hypothetical protein NQ318_003244, partial [Aromia moschata]